jgi:uncharacterized membrane protein YqjE
VAEPSEPTLAGTAARLWAVLIEGLHLRIELFALELGEERRRIVELMFSALALALAVLLLAVSLNVVLLVLLWDTHRVAVAIGTCLFYAGAAIGCGLHHRRLGRRQSPPFAATTAVLARDQEALRDLR